MAHTFNFSSYRSEQVYCATAPYFLDLKFTVEKIVYKGKILESVYNKKLRRLAIFDNQYSCTVYGTTRQFRF